MIDVLLRCIQFLPVAMETKEHIRL